MTNHDKELREAITEKISEGLREYRPEGKPIEEISDRILHLITADRERAVREAEQIYSTVHNNSRVILYTDVIGLLNDDGSREQVSRDDLWAISTDELLKLVPSKATLTTKEGEKDNE